MRSVTLSYLVLLVALLTAVDARPVQSGDDVDAHPTTTVISTSVSPPRAVHFFVRSLPAEMQALELPPIQSSPRTSEPANDRANHYATAVYNAVRSALVSTTQRLSLVHDIATATAAAVRETLQPADATPLPLSIVHHIDVICGTVAGAVTTSLSQSVALVAGQTAYNRLGGRAGSADNDWPGPRKNSGDDDVAAGGEGAPRTRASYFTRWIIRQQARKAVAHVLWQISETWPMSRFDALRSADCQALNGTDCQWLRAAVDRQWSGMTRALERRLRETLVRHEGSLADAADSATDNAFVLVLYSIAGARAFAPVATFTGFTRNIRNAVRKENVQQKMNQLIQSGRAMKQSVANYPRDKYNWGVAQALRSIRPMLMLEMEPAVRIFKQYTANDFPREIERLLLRLLDVPPMGRPLGAPHEKPPLGTLVKDAAVAIYNMPAGAVPTTTMPGTFVQHPPRPEPRVPSVSTKLYNRFKSMFHMPAAGTLTQNMPGASTSQLIRRANVLTAVAGHALKQMSRLERWILSKTWDKILANLDRVIEPWNRQLDAFMKDFLADNILAHMEERLTWERGRTWPNAILMIRLRQNEINEIQAANNNLNNNNNNNQAGQRVAPHLQPTSNANYVTRSLWKGRVRKLVTAAVDKLFILLDPEIKVMVDKVVKKATDEFPWLLYNIILDVAEQYTPGCQKFRRPTLSPTLSKAIYLGKAVVRWPAQAALQLYRASGLARVAAADAQQVVHQIENNPDVCQTIRAHLDSMYKVMHAEIVDIMEAPLVALSDDMLVKTVRVLKRTIFQKAHTFLPIFPDQF
ncbi:hypothetical protein SYNPS1DRAFT_20834 [Syncephalis pseudoplumigaleata]|uniref:Uncharacterized protein n=1 Tax=Syncephalis pseudoplumigaleata TaxID=1712513 RepID=A0A4P9Z6D3_9FUNG|nr:hypothetical protein SYNPS1DRAFT_20834 [Syncephalis pseudoplumigaleata]|eukprot:RKP27712.1 hypothetical protein SYNPS1DRAFT_20834 [Syncephalis pseudoplumigaleata]